MKTSLPPPASVCSRIGASKTSDQIIVGLLRLGLEDIVKSWKAWGGVCGLFVLKKPREELLRL